MTDNATIQPSAAPLRWCDIARDLAEAGAFRIGIRPWNWLELAADQAALVWELLGGFVEFLNERYGVDSATRVPPCWAEHGAVVEELTTLAFSHWQAFSSTEASIATAQSWHGQILPAFYEHLGRWLKGTRMFCDVGRHRSPEQTVRGGTESWKERARTLAANDVAIRKQREHHACAGTDRSNDAVKEG